jgi:ADP-ribosylglycohydrolase
MTDSPDIDSESPSSRSLPRHSQDELMRARFRGCLLGGAVGDAIGAPVEFWSRDRIIATCGPQGVRDYLPAYGRIGAITDDTQMTLFTADALLRSYVRDSTRGIGIHGGLLRRSYLRWYRTQGGRHPDIASEPLDGWLMSHRELFAQRAPGNTCLEALRKSDENHRVTNQSKGCGTVMRVAPIGLYCGLPATDCSGPRQAFELGCRSSLITHGHVTATQSAGFLSAVIALLCDSHTLDSAIEAALPLLMSGARHDETLGAIEAARTAAAQSPNDPDRLATLGEGWVAEEALSIALYCALGTDDFEDAISLAVSHDGDSDSTGSITGNLLGTIHGDGAIPERWLKQLELREAIEEVAEDLASYPDWNLTDNRETDFYFERYPPG